ncbi:MAG: hypothetical protein M0Z50_05685 [Planctomycetia bacterium]|nr:hypothetical protein [Planctomycetia bacterium]
MNAQELKDFQEKERQEKERLEKSEQEKKEREDKARYEKLAVKDDQDKKAREQEKIRDKKQAEKAYKPRSAEGKAREKMRKTPEHQAMREAIKEQVAGKEKTAKEGASGPHVVRDPGQQAEADKYRGMHQADAKAALGAVGKAHGSPEMQGLHGTKDFEAQQATAALRAQGDQKPWKQAQQHNDQPHDQAKAPEYGKGRDHTDPERVGRDTGPDRPGPAPAPAHAHHGHHMPWDKNPHEQHGGHGHHLSKESGQELAQGKPWQNRADPDQAESRMAQQAREREQERGR